MGIQVLVNCDVVILNLCICTFITTISQQMAAKCLEKERKRHVSIHTGTLVLSHWIWQEEKMRKLLAKRDEEGNRVRTLLN